MFRFVSFLLSTSFLLTNLAFAEKPLVPGIPKSAVPFDFLSKGLFSQNLFNWNAFDIGKVGETAPILKFRESVKLPRATKEKEQPLDQLIEKVTTSQQPIAILLFRNPFSFLFPAREETGSYVLISRIPRELIQYFSGMRIACPSKSGKENVSIYFDVAIVNQLPINLDSEIVDPARCYATYNFFNSQEKKEGRSLNVLLKLPQSLFPSRS